MIAITVDSVNSFREKYTRLESTKGQSSTKQSVCGVEIDKKKLTKW